MQQGAEVVDLLDGDLVVEGRPDELQRVGPQLETLLQSLVNLRHVVVQRKPENRTFNTIFYLMNPLIITQRVKSFYF